MSANKLSIVKTLIILGCFVWLLPAQADEASSTIDIVSSTPVITTSTTDITTTTTQTDTTSTTPSTNADLATSSISIIDSTSTIEVATTTTSATTTETNTSTTEQQVQTNGGGSNTQTQILINSSEINNAVQKILNFLKSNQLENGSVIDGQTSDWSAMSFAANNTYPTNVKNGTASLYDYVYNYDNALLDQELNNCAAYSRHILALLASGVATNDSKINTLKIKLDGCVQNSNFGLPGINDDIFGLLAALAIGEDSNSPVVQNTLTTIKANQQASGAFAYPGEIPYEAPDLTGAALNALKYAQNKGVAIEVDIFTKAKQYLKAQQLADGGWGFGASDALTTGWAVMGINALGEDQTSWFNNNHKNPWHVLTALDNDHFTQSWDGGIDWFGTKHAVPALLGKSWPIILTPLASNQNTADSVSSGGSGTPSTSTPATSIITPTSTPTTTPILIVIETSTPNFPTTTGEVLGEKITREEVIKPIIKKQKIIIAKNTALVVKNKTIPTTQTEPEIIEPVIPQTIETSNNPTRNTAKIILAVSGGGALLIGIYLGLKSLKK